MMIKVEHIETWGFEHAIRGMRNPMSSWDKSDSRKWGMEDGLSSDYFVIGEKDLELMQKLFKAGTEHRKYLRQIFVSMDITAPQFWWSEFDTYKVGTVADSCSKMHKLMAKEFTLDDFSFDVCLEYAHRTYLESIIDDLNSMRDQYINFDEYAAKGMNAPDVTREIVWRALLELLPESYNQKRTITMNYENVFNMIHQRENHKLQEWRDFVKVLKDLPYVREIGGIIE